MFGSQIGVFMDGFANQIFQQAVKDLKAERARLVPNYQPPDPIPERREVIERLLEHQRIVYRQPAKAYDLVEECLIRLGVTNRELLANLEGVDDGAALPCRR
jgi:hypothetical protein